MNHMMMEPMTLGSPPHSPVSPGVNPNFLPSFLMGEPQSNTPNANISPGRNRTPNVKIGGFNTPSDPRNLRQKLFNQSLNESTYNQSSYNNNPADRTGPPKQGLFDTFDQNKAPQILCSTIQNPTEHPMLSPNESFSRIGSDSLNYTQASINNDSYNNKSGGRSGYLTVQTMRSERIDTLWITVFGFPPSATSLVLAQLSNCGCIGEKKFPTQGNWVNLKYGSPHEVAKALSLNGKLLSSNIMIGVVPFYNKQENKENLECNEVKSPMRARSLRQSFVLPQANSPVMPQNVPQKSTGLVTKAMEYVFGW